MVRSGYVRAGTNLGIAAALTIFLGACSSLTPSAPPEPPPLPEVPATIRSDGLDGRWGLASYQDPNDRARTEAAARGQCKQPYVIGAGATGGVIMHLADQATPQELRLRAVKAARIISDRPDRPAANRIEKSSPSTDASWSSASSTRMPRPATATWSMSAAGPRLTRV